MREELGSQLDIDNVHMESIITKVREKRKMRTNLTHFPIDDEIVFEMPLVSWLLSQIGLLNRSFFHKYRRHAVVGLLVGAAFITPSSDPFTLSIVFLPLYGLYELSAFFVKKAPKEEDEENEEDNNEE